MARHWISYSVDERPRRRRRWWRWRWPWRRGPRYGRPHLVRAQPTRQRVRRDGDRRSIWPWLLLLLFLLLFLGLLAFLLFDEPERSGSAERDNGGSEPAATAGPVAGGVAPPAGPSLALSSADDGAMVSAPDRPALRLGDDTKVLDLGDGACHDQRYVLMTDGKAIPIEELDEATVEALARSDVPIDTVALGPNVDTSALQTIASRTGGTFTKMD